MDVFSTTKAPTIGAVLLYEADANYSRATMNLQGGSGGIRTVELGTLLKAGTAGTVVPWDGTGTVVGVALQSVAAADGIAEPFMGLNRDALVARSGLIYAGFTPTGAQVAQAQADLLALGIKIDG